MGDNMKRTNIYLDDDDRRAIAAIQSAHGQEHASAAIRFALRETARQLERTKRRSARPQQPGPGGEGDE